MDDWQNMTTNCSLDLSATLLVLYGDGVVDVACGGIETSVFEEAFAPSVGLAFERRKQSK